MLTLKLKINKWYIFAVVVDCLAKLNSSTLIDNRQIFQDGDLKLVDGPNENAGTLLVYRTYGWGRICDDHWTLKEATVVCKQLKMGHALEAHRRNKFGSIVGKDYLMDEVRCIGNETRLTDCKFLGWGKHDCKHNEEVGVKCAYVAPTIEKPKWNLLKLNLKYEELEIMSKINFSLIHNNNSHFKVLMSNNTELNPVVIETTNEGFVGLVCADYFRATETIVFCRQLNLGYGGQVIPISPLDLGMTNLQIIAIIGRCYGNETSLNQCVTYVNSSGIECKSQMSAVVKCAQDLPDLIPEKHSLESSSYMQKMSLWLLECALEENCLPESVYQIIEKNPHSYQWMSRSLMRFSSIIKNIGKDAFKPFEEPENWEWHACHMHYHSMKVFSRYEVVDPENRLVAVGHKASFCLEDNLCTNGIEPKYRCSNVVHSKGTQGISPGCEDMYLHDYDCQWVDITDVPPGVYTFQVSFNPDFLVPESDFFNNAMSCQLNYFGYNAVLRQCHYVHPNDLF